MLSNTYEQHELGTGKNARRVATILLPYACRVTDLPHAPRHVVQNWQTQAEHFVCRGSEWADPVYGHSSKKDVHLVMDEPVKAHDKLSLLTRGDGKATKHVHQNTQMLMTYSLMTNNSVSLRTHLIRFDA